MTARSALPIGPAQRKREELERRARRDTQTTVRRFVDLAQVLFEARDANAEVLRLVDRRIGLDRLREDLDRAERILRPHGTGHRAPGTSISCSTPPARPAASCSPASSPASSSGGQASTRTSCSPR
jgi:hypothetical protein